MFANEAAIMKEIGGYLEMELGPGGRSYHSGVLALNSGRSALEYILRLRKYDKLFLPHYHCEALLVPLHRLGIQYDFYHIDSNFEFRPFRVPENAGLLYINFFGLKDSFIDDLARQHSNLIVDNAQAFYSRPHPGVDTLYSCRKFFGVPDGAFVSCSGRLPEHFQQDVSAFRYQHLVGRRDQSASDYFSFYRSLEESFNAEEIKFMSGSTLAAMDAIDYGWALRRRRANYATLHSALRSMNRLDLPNLAAGVAYPFLASHSLRQRLIERKIYIATYWPNVLKNMPEHTTEYDLAYNIVSLPIDQRYDSGDMKIIIECIVND